MSTLRCSRWSFARALAGAGLLLGACQPGQQASRQPGPGSQPSAPPAAVTPTASPSFSGCAGQPTLTPTVPADMASAASQANANCFAWQEFIGLNWAANPASCTADSSVPASAFGAPSTARPPGPMGPVVWQTYLSPASVYLPGARPPGPWCPGPAGAYPPALTDYKEASKGGPWLTDQAGELTMYQMAMNQDEFNYVTTYKLYNAVTQARVAVDQNEGGINLPDGVSSTFGTTGAIEIKAAWVELDHPAEYKDYLTTTATVTYPTQAPRQVVMGLVGLHIIHKTQRAAQLVWATFEHVANAPSTTDIASHKLLPAYTFYNAACDPKTNYYQCQPNVASPTVAPMSAPMQVVRTTPIPSSTNNVVGLNQAVWDLIRAANPSSVFLHYQLVNVLWPLSPVPMCSVSQPQPCMSAGTEVTLYNGNAQPPQAAQPVANTVIETYVQQLNCMACHANAAVAATTTLPPAPATPAPLPAPLPAPSPSPSPIGSDYSFLFGKAAPP